MLMSKGLVCYYFIGIVSALGLSFISYFAFRYHVLKLPAWVMWVLPIFSIYLLFSQLLKYESLHFYVDFSHWAQVIYNICVSGKPLSVSEELIVPGSKNYLSVHFSPYVYLIAIPFKIWPHGLNLLLINFILMMSSIIPIYKLAATCNEDKRFGLFMVSLLVFYPTFQYLVLYEFGMLRFVIPIALWMLYFWEKKRMKSYYFFVLLSVFVREEVGLTILMFGIYLILIEKNYRAGFITALTGGVAFAVITQFIMPALRDGGYEHVAMGSFSVFGSSVWEILINIIRNPALVLSTVIKPIKLANIFMLFIPLLFIPFFAPAVLIAVLANFGVGLLSQSNLHISYMLFYVSPSIPFIFYAFIKGWPKLLELLVKLDRQNLGPGEHRDINSAAMATVLAGLLVVNVFFGPSPISLQFWFKNLRPAPFETQNFHWSVYKLTDHHRMADEISALIPESAIISASHFLHSKLFKKKGTLMFPNLESKNGTIKADYVFFDKTNNGLKKASTAYRTQHDFDLIEKDTKTWALVKSKDGYYLYKRKATPTD